MAHLQASEPYESTIEAYTTRSCSFKVKWESRQALRENPGSPSDEAIHRRLGLKIPLSNDLIGSMLKALPNLGATNFGQWLHSTRVHDKLDYTSRHSKVGRSDTLAICSHGKVG